MMAPVLQLFVFVAASALLQSASSAPQNDSAVYAVTVSSEVIAGGQEVLCAHIEHLSEPINLTVALEVYSASTVLLEEPVAQPFYRCLRFQVPQVRTRTVASVKVDLQGAKATTSKKTKILIKPPAFIHLVQTDKPIYKPGQTVLFRIVSLDADFMSVNQVYKLVELEDPNSNRIAQWLNKTIDGGILDFSHPMIPEAVQGTYKITASTDKGEKVSHSFKIKEYVLPKFEVKVSLPSVITILDREVAITICGKYTYGKPVIGSVKATLCRRAQEFWWNVPLDICKQYQMETDRSGCASKTVSLVDFDIQSDHYQYSFDLSAEIKEHGTGVTLTGNGETTLTRIIRTVTFEETLEWYKPGIPFEGKVKVVGPNNSPLANTPVYLSGPDRQNLTTDLKGMASFSFDTTGWSGSTFITATSRSAGVDESRTRSAFLTPVPFYSKGKSFVKLMHMSGRILCGETASVRAQYMIEMQELRAEQESLDFFFLVTSRGAIVQNERVPVTVNAKSGEVSLTLRNVSKLAPFAQVLIYTLMPSGEVVADSWDYPVQRCLNNQVALKFSSLEQLPAERTSLNLQAHPGSLCSVRAIDQSVLLLQTEQELTASYVYNKLPWQRLSGYSYEVDDDASYPCFPFMGDFLESHGSPSQKNDVYSIFKEIGMKLLTNSDVKQPADCMPRMVMFAEYDDEMMSMAEIPLRNSPVTTVTTSKKKTETVRKFFPETWIWDIVPVGDSGSVSMEKTVPDTITKWAAGAFCVSPVGFGVAPSVGLTAFQPFFVSLTLPYSVVRGESFTLKATVFNYLTECIMVQVTLAQSDQYSFRDCNGCIYTVCLCQEESRTFSWIVTPSSLGGVSVKVSAEALRTDVLCGNEVAVVPAVGQVDTVIRTLLVEAEGTPQMVSHNALLCPAEGPVVKNVSLLMPEMFVAGSARASVSVLGDIMGRAMKNIDKLLAMPFGCGEQNMILFAPNIFILNYLKSTGQLTQEIQDRATRFLKSGYQRELNYKHDDGSYSAFGMGDASGNTWLTAFVMKSFGGARPYIFVEPKHIADARSWLAGHRRRDGCITSVGKLFHNEMKGGVSDDVSLTAYVAAALLELDPDVTEPVVRRCLSCLREAAVGQMDNLYTTALLSYTFTLAGDEQMRGRLLRHLDQRSSTQDGTRHWGRTRASGTGLDSLEVEMTSYVLLALLSGPPMPDFNLDYTTSIVRWLTQQQNPFGGFSSTQDTVVALQALAKYGTTIYSQVSRTTVTVTSLGGLSKEFTVDESNRLLYQEEKLSEVPGEYTIRAEGLSCVMAQISMHYNIPPPADSPAFNISAFPRPRCNLSRPELSLRIVVGYQGRRTETNMVIINIKLLSGYVVDKSSIENVSFTLQHLRRGLEWGWGGGGGGVYEYSEDGCVFQQLKKMTGKGVKRVDVEEGYVNIYIDGMKKNTQMTYLVMLEEDLPVRNLKPAVIKIYDYYQTSEEAVTEYTTSCAERDIVNKL
ncbi:alpha-2-macroglobulin-P [Nelusetta ayraudi]|uniref:alpha-2-macroglobulin-P n=1 Tax=Nelusetta ayraudi TaxID=303726 RepID=UPI003F6E6616